MQRADGGRGQLVEGLLWLKAWSKTRQSFANMAPSVKHWHRHFDDNGKNQVSPSQPLRREVIFPVCVRSSKSIETTFFEILRRVLRPEERIEKLREDFDDNKAGDGKFTWLFHTELSFDANLVQNGGAQRLNNAEAQNTKDRLNKLLGPLLQDLLPDYPDLALYGIGCCMFEDHRVRDDPIKAHIEDHRDRDDPIKAHIEVKFSVGGRQPHCSEEIAGCSWDPKTPKQDLVVNIHVQSGPGYTRTLENVIKDAALKYASILPGLWLASVEDIRFVDNGRNGKKMLSLGRACAPDIMELCINNKYMPGEMNYYAEMKDCREYPTIWPHLENSFEERRCKELEDKAAKKTTAKKIETQVDHAGETWNVVTRKK